MQMDRFFQKWGHSKWTMRIENIEVQRLENDHFTHSHEGSKITWGTNHQKIDYRSIESHGFLDPFQKTANGI